MLLADRQALLHQLAGDIELTAVAQRRAEVQQDQRRGAGIAKIPRARERVLECRRRRIEVSAPARNCGPVDEHEGERLVGAYMAPGRKRVLVVQPRRAVDAMLEHQPERDRDETRGGRGEPLEADDAQIEQPIGLSKPATTPRNACADA
jgi:hypothetical protein